MRRLIDRTPLRVKLVVAVLALTACALGLMGVATVTALRNHLIGRLDDQLGSIGDDARNQIASGQGVLSLQIPQASDGNMHVPDPYFLETLLPDNTVRSSHPNPPPADAPDLTAADLSRTDPFTVDARSGTGRWRVLVVTAPNGSHLVIACRMTEVDNTLSRLLWLVTLIGAAILVAVALVGVWLVRASLRPLTEIELATTEIAAGDLSRRVPSRDPRTEVGRLGEAFNVMIARIEDAFAGQAASETAARSAESRAVQSEERMRQFIADASHELRTPLTVIRGFAELHRQGAVRDPEAVARLVGRIEDESLRMGLLVDDLLLLARLDQRRPLATEPVDLARLAADAVGNARALAPDRPVTLDLTTIDDLPVYGDERRLRQVVMNLLTNALTHTPPDADITVRLARDGDQAVLDVIDTGPGLTAEQTAHVFERFYRGDEARTRSGRGPTSTGLGLSIAAAIVTAHAGTIEVDSTPGHGATFRVTLPLSPDLAHATTGPDLPSNPPSPVPQGLPPQPRVDGPHP
jgi:two-component system OmpR family sensor kinase